MFCQRTQSGALFVRNSREENSRYFHATNLPVVIEWSKIPAIRASACGNHLTLERDVAELLGDHLGIGLDIQERLAPSFGIPEFEPGVCAYDHHLGLQARILAQKRGNQDPSLPVGNNVCCSRKEETRKVSGRFLGKGQPLAQGCRELLPIFIGEYEQTPIKPAGTAIAVRLEDSRTIHAVVSLDGGSYSAGGCSVSAERRIAVKLGRATDAP